MCCVHFCCVRLPFEGLGSRSPKNSYLEACRRTFFIATTGWADATMRGSEKLTGCGPRTCPARSWPPFGRIAKWRPRSHKIISLWMALWRKLALRRKASRRRNERPSDQAMIRFTRREQVRPDHQEGASTKASAGHQPGGSALRGASRPRTPNAPRVAHTWLGKT